jgi:hypothetical protein
MMKNFQKWFLAICLLLCVGNVYAQHRYYCEVKGIEKELSSGLKIIFDFGTKTSYTIWGDLSSKLKFVDENGEEIKFNSMVDAANYMVDRGWTFQQAYSSTYGEKPIIHWIFYKDAEDMEKAREGIMTKSEYQKLHKK